MSIAQQLLDDGKIVITPFEGYWHIFLPRKSWLVDFFGDYIFRTGFESDVAEDTVRDFYARRAAVSRDEIVRVDAEEQASAEGKGRDG